MRASSALASALSVAVGVGVAVALVWGATFNSAPVSCLRGGGFSGHPLGSTVAIGAPRETTVGPNHWYNASIVSASPNLELGNLKVQIQNSGGGTVTPGPLWSLTVVNLAGTPVAAYSLTGTNAGSWSWGQHQAVFNNLVLDLLTNPENISGNQWVVYLVGSDVNGCLVSGSISTEIP
ncbi:MAG TPA: hypothetical protein VFG07_08910 [Thermoplasmata archaeon]|nr:hypothetical protein [Thermoplasmata archaeon]